MNDYVHIEAADLRRPNARFTTERQGYQVLTPFGKLGYSHFFRHYKDPRDWLTVFRAVLHLPGAVRRDGDHVRVTLRPPDSPRVRRALAAMLDDINRTEARLFGTGPRLRFELAA